MTRTVNYTVSTGIGAYSLKRSGSNSTRNSNGRLVLRQNSFSYQKQTANYCYWSADTKCTPNYSNRDTHSAGFSPLGAFLGLKDGFYNIPGKSKTFLIDQCKIELRNKIREQDFNLAVAYAEKNSTADLILGTARNLLSAAKHVKAGRFKAASRALGVPHRPIGRNRKGLSARESFSSNWLQYSYGWVPLYNDMYGSMVACDNAIRGLPDRFQKCMVRRSADHYTYSISKTRPWSNTTMVPSVRQETRIQQCFKVAASVKITNPFAHTVDSLGLTNPALVAWELVPFSFVVDWSLGIGSWLSQLPPLLGLSIKDVYFTTFSNESFKTKLNYGNRSSVLSDRPNPSVPLVNCDYQESYIVGEGNLQRVYILREVGNLSAVTDFPRPKLPDDWRQAATALALFTQFMSKHGHI